MLNILFTAEERPVTSMLGKVCDVTFNLNVVHSVLQNQLNVHFTKKLFCVNIKCHLQI